MSGARSRILLGIVVAFVAGGCGGGSSSSGGSSGAPSDVPSAAVSSARSSSAEPTQPGAATGAQVRITNFIDGGSVAATTADGRPVVMVHVQVTGAVPLVLTLKANGIIATDARGRQIEYRDAKGTLPVDAEFAWSPPFGGGEYELTISGWDDQKNEIKVVYHVTVTGVPHVTPPPVATRDQALATWNARMLKDYGVSIPKPSLQRFDSPDNPARSRWIGAAYYKGFRYYGEMYDNGQMDLGRQAYSDPAHRGSDTFLCRPAGTFKALIVFVDYGNVAGVTKNGSLADIPVVVDWLNRSYDNFAKKQGFASSPVHVSADGVWMDSPPEPFKLLTAEQIKSRTGKNVADYDFVDQVDIDKSGGYGVKAAPDALTPGSALATNGCATRSKLGAVSIWSNMIAPSAEVRLDTDFNHELSHLFGMRDTWPWAPGTGPTGAPIEDWISYDLFGWTDTDGDGIAEIVDPTPYGTAGPRP